MERHRLAARHVHEQGLGARDRDVVEQGARDGRLRGLVRAVGSGRVPRPHERVPPLRHHGLHVREVQVHEARNRDQVRDPLGRVMEHLVRHPEGFLERRGAIHDREEPLVRDHDQRVHPLFQFAQAVLGQLHPPAAFELEGPGHHRDRERTLRLRDARHDGSRAGAGAAPHARGHEDHVRAVQELGDPGLVLLGRVAADVRVGARAQPLRHPGPELELPRAQGLVQNLGVGVGGDELDAPQPRLDHSIDRVPTRSADTDHLDRGPQHRFPVIDQLEHRLTPPLVPLVRPAPRSTASTRTIYG